MNLGEYQQQNRLSCYASDERRKYYEFYVLFGHKLTVYFLLPSNTHAHRISIRFRFCSLSLNNVYKTYQYHRKVPKERIAKILHILCEGIRRTSVARIQIQANTYADMDATHLLVILQFQCLAN